MRIFARWVVLGVFAVGCSGSSGAGSDTGSDAADTGIDVAIDSTVDGGMDGTTDAGADTAADSATDTGTDAATDAAADSVTDAATDAAADSVTDSAGDASMDAVSDTGSACVAVGQQCLSAAECCNDRACELDSSGDTRCVDELTCSAVGSACTQASQCCSLLCSGGECGDSSSGDLCTPAGDGCSGDVDCCSNDCDDEAADAGAATCQAHAGGTGCASLGEVCDSEGFDVDCCSRYCANYGTSGTPELRCARSSTCGARGDICVEETDCCSGVCNDGQCPTQDEIGGPRFAGEPCEVDSDCASYACAPRIIGGPRVCQFLGGCRPAGEICTDDWQCCGTEELSAGGRMCREPEQVVGACADTPVAGLKACELQLTDKEIGEICGYLDDGSVLHDVHDCCGGDEVCQLSISGVYRCRGGVYLDDPSCHADGEGCQIADECCSHVCAPAETDGGTSFVCGTCRGSGDSCTTHADCCGFTCAGGVCEGTPPPDGGTGDGGADGGSSDGGAGDGSAGDAGPGDGGNPICVPVGANCSESAECCSQLCYMATGTCVTIF